LIRPTKREYPDVVILPQLREERMQVKAEAIHRRKRRFLRAEKNPYARGLYSGTPSSTTSDPDSTPVRAAP
jgi:hypothetical protein